MKTVCAKNMCAGCMACTNICKMSAITIIDDYKSYNAVIDEVKLSLIHISEPTRNQK